MKDTLLSLSVTLFYFLRTSHQRVLILPTYATRRPTFFGATKSFTYLYNHTHSLLSCCDLRQFWHIIISFCVNIMQPTNSNPRKIEKTRIRQDNNGNKIYWRKDDIGNFSFASLAAAEAMVKPHNIALLLSVTASPAAIFFAVPRTLLASDWRQQLLAGSGDPLPSLKWTVRSSSRFIRVNRNLREILCFLAHRTATQYDRLLPAACCPSVRLSVCPSVCL